MLRTLVAAFLVSFLIPTFAETSVSGPPTSTAHEQWENQISASCQIKGKKISQRFSRQLATNGMQMIVVITFVNGTKVAHADMLIPVGVKSYVKTAAGWVLFDSMDDSDGAKLESTMLATLGLTKAEWEKCSRESKKS